MRIDYFGDSLIPSHNLFLENRRLSGAECNGCDGRDDPSVQLGSAHNTINRRHVEIDGDQRPPRRNVMMSRFVLRCTTIRYLAEGNGVATVIGCAAANRI